MTAAISAKKLYCFDTSAFVTLSRTSENVIPIPDELWQHLEEMIKKGEIISHKLVFNEIVSKSKNPDFISRWLTNKEKYFLDRTQFQLDLAPKIVANFSSLVDPGSEHEQADVWLIALAAQKLQENPLFGGNKVVVVSQENINSTKKIPAACKFFNVKHMSLREFFGEIGVGIELTKK